MSEFSTYLLKRPILASIIVILIYMLSTLIPGQIYLLIGSSSSLFLIYALIFYFIVPFVVLILYIPLFLNLPLDDEDLYSFLKSIKLNLDTIRPLRKTIPVFFIFAVIMLLTAVFSGILMGTNIFSPERFFGWPQPGNPGWFIFIIALAPAIWEEIAFRGINTTMYLEKYEKKEAILINGIIFGLFHFGNLLFGAPLFYTLIQVFYAITLGFVFGYIFIETKSLIPCILLHYLLNVITLLFRFSA